MRGPPGQRDGWSCPAGEHQVAVGRECVGQGRQPGGARRCGGHRMNVVEDDAHGRRCPSPHGVGDRTGVGVGVGDGVLGGAGVRDAAGWFGVVRRRPHDRRPARQGGGDVTGQRVIVRVGGFDTQPDVVATGCQAVLGDRLGHERGLAEPRSPDHRRDPVVPAAEQSPQQTGPGQRAGSRLGGLEPKRARHVVPTVRDRREQGVAGRTAPASAPLMPPDDTAVAPATPARERWAGSAAGGDLPHPIGGNARPAVAGHDMSWVPAAASPLPPPSLDLDPGSLGPQARCWARGPTERRRVRRRRPRRSPSWCPWRRSASRMRWRHC